MAQINQWEDVTSLECNSTGNSTCFHNGNDVISYYGFEKVCGKNFVCRTNMK
jgi:hypothetical protein